MMVFFITNLAAAQVLIQLVSKKLKLCLFGIVSFRGMILTLQSI